MRMKTFIITTAFALTATSGLVFAQDLDTLGTAGPQLMSDNEMDQIVGGGTYEFMVVTPADTETCPISCYRYTSVDAQGLTDAYLNPEGEIIGVFPVDTLGGDVPQGRSSP